MSKFGPKFGPKNNAAFCRDCLSDFDVGTSDNRCPTCGSPRIVDHPELRDLTLAHIDCDAFYASVEKRDNPDLLSQPLIIGGGQRGVVATCCYIARASGIHSAMPMFQAKKLCPEAVILPPDMKKYSQASQQIRAIFDQMSPSIEPLSIDEAFIDLSGTEKLHGTYAAKTIARAVLKIEQDVGITVSVGLSYNKFLAKLSSDFDKPRGFSLIGRAEATTLLAPLPISKIWGVGKVLNKKMNQAGIRQIGQLQALDKHQLIRKYGIMGERLYHFSRGQDSRHVNSQTRLKSISNETTFSKDLSDYDQLKALLWPLCEKVSLRLKDKIKAGTVITLKLKTASFRQISRSTTLESPTQMAEMLFDVGNHLLKPECGGLSYRLIGIGVSGLCGIEQADQPDLIDTGRSKKIKTERLLDSIRQKYGNEVIKKGRNL
ncbi:MAG: DNA polymerase IV [Alphaproteobacteria bacterium]|nr:MAG: DNA polymerase IV [Alphaproteobacteria bacterium]